jgi:hypothetical protein
VPLQRVIERHPLTDQPLAMLDQQPQIERRTFQLRGRQRFEPFGQRRPGHGQRVDEV